MIKQSERQAALVKGVFRDAYLFYQKYHEKEDMAGFWIEASDEFSEIVRKYGGEPICMKIVLAVFMQLEGERGGRYDRSDD